MKIRRVYSMVLVPTLLLGLVALPAIGQESGFATKGVVELAGSVSFSSFVPVTAGNTGSATTVFTFGPQIGYFVTDGFEIGFNPGITLFEFLPGISVISGSGGGSETMLQLFVYPGYTFRPAGSNVFPFVEVPFGYTSVGDGSSESGFSWGIKGGVKIDVAKHLLLTMYGEYLQVTLNPSTTNPFANTSSGRNGLDFISFGVSVGGFF